jgi:hypothetical protein
LAKNNKKAFQRQITSQAAGQTALIMVKEPCVMATKIPVGDKVYRESDPRHHGRIEAIKNSAFARVRWDANGWLEMDVPVREPVKVPQKMSIEGLKRRALVANTTGNLVALNKIMTQLELCWDDAEARLEFYKQLNGDR